MRSHAVWAILVLSLPLFFAGCGQRSPDASAAQKPVVWVEQGIEQDGFSIDLGYRGPTVDAERFAEPVVAIARDGKPVANAMVFNRLAGTNEKETISEEVATVYEPASGADKPLYAQGRLQVPEGITSPVVEFRIVLPDVEQEWLGTLELPMK